MTNVTTHIGKLVQEHLPNADELTHRLVTATVGLLVGVAYSDRDYSDVEEAMVRKRLSQLDSFSRLEVNAVCKVLRAGIDALRQDDPSTWPKVVNELTDRWQRLELLELLVDVAGADEVLTKEESAFLERTAEALELGADDLKKSLDRLSVTKET